jgi:protein-S-isoprenylcysteine O-methyltransferase Ste14
MSSPVLDAATSMVPAVLAFVSGAAVSAVKQRRSVARGWMAGGSVVLTLGSLAWLFWFVPAEHHSYPLPLVISIAWILWLARVLQRPRLADPVE